jgi:heptaprenylglyceryl phosphate synthase
MLGHKLIYLEAGSGANCPVPPHIIKEVKENISIPLIVGGGLKEKVAIESAYQSGADIVVVGNALESNPTLLKNLLG